MSKSTQDVLLHSADEVAVISTDTEGLITVFNAGAEQLLGYSSDEIMGEPIPMVGFEIFQNSDSLGSNSIKNATVIHKDGSNIQVDINATPINDHQGALSGLLFMANVRRGPAQYIALHDLHGAQVFSRVLDREYRRMQRQQSPIGLIYVNMDYYKDYLAEYGEAAAQECLTQIANILNERIQRAGDMLTYHGADDFRIILPHTDLPGTVKVAEYVRLMVENLKLEHKRSKVGSAVTISCGLVNFTPGADNSMALLMEQAEAGLKKSKADGRNCSRIGE